MKTGTHEMTIFECGFIKSSKETPGVQILGTIGEETVKAMIWISEKSAWMAHKALRNCGFDTETQDLQELKDNPALLRGHTVQVRVTEDQYGLKVEIVLDIEPNATELAAANAILKGLKPSGSAPTGAPKTSAADSPF